jgi:hypothetical protein
MTFRIKNLDDFPTLTESSNIAFWEELKFQNFRSDDTKYKKNGSCLIFSIYLKSYNIFGGP